MDGRIGFESEEGRGTTFRFTAVFEKQQTVPVTLEKDENDLRGVRVLVLDDRAAIGMAINRPYAMNAAIPPSTRLTGKKKLCSPRTM